jgi:tRNA threonylcarbamoyladenosine biosynthesis protein TsaE
LEIAFEYSLKDLEKTAQTLLKYVSKYPVLLLQGEVGAGKTTLVKALCKEMGVLENVSSPTYTIVNEYNSHSGEIIYHFDLYRLKTEAEAEDIGLCEYLDSGHRCIVEWPEMAPHLIEKREAAHVNLQHLNEQKRKISVIFA